jgi:hypothetical protein
MRVRFADRTAAGETALAEFRDPAPRFAVVGEAGDEAGGDFLEVMIVPLAAAHTVDAGRGRALAEWVERGRDADAVPPVYVKYRGVEAMWRAGRAALECDASEVDSLLKALVEFSHYERELRRIEEEIANGWVDLEQDKGLAFDVTPRDLARGEAVGARMARVMQQRIRYARIEPHLFEADARLTPGAQKLGGELRERSRIESRLETVDAQIEVFEGVYEMASQRMGEYRAAREEHVLEWVIIVLLAAEALLMLAQTVWRHAA